MDVKSIILNDYLEEEVYNIQPLRYMRKKEEHKVYKMKKVLYRLKQPHGPGTQESMLTFRRTTS